MEQDPIFNDQNKGEIDVPIKGIKIVYNFSLLKTEEPIIISKN